RGRDVMKKQQTFVEKFSSILHKQGTITADQSKAYKKMFYDRSQEAFDDFLLEEGLVSRPDLLKALSEYYQVPSFDVSGHFFSYFRLHEFPKDFLLRNSIIPLECDEVTLIVVASAPDDGILLKKIGDHVAYDIAFFVGLAQDIQDAVKEYYD